MVARRQETEAAASPERRASVACAIFGRKTMTRFVKPAVAGLLLLSPWIGACRPASSHVAVEGSPPTLPVQAPSSSSDASSPPAESAAVPSSVPASVVAAPALLPPVVVLERVRCRAAGPFYKVAMSEDGRLELTGDVGQTDGSPRVTWIARAEVRSLVDRLLAANIGASAHAVCTQSDTQQCSMHPCTISLQVSRAGATQETSWTNDAPRPGPELLAGVIDVERVARLWQWIDAGASATSISPCSSQHDCTVRADSCGGLHARLLGDRHPPEGPGSCAQTIQPRGDVEPICRDGRCAMAPVNDPSRTCSNDAQCTPVANGCTAYGAIRRDRERIREIAIRNDHLHCAETDVRSPMPAVACLHGVCITRAPAH